jgi:hypothetical protein
MSQKLSAAIAVIGIDIGKNSFHIVGHDHRGAIVLRQKWSRGQAMSAMPPKAEVYSDHQRLRDGALRVDGTAVDVINLRNWSLESCATNSAIMNGPRSNRCCRTSRTVCGV